ncbi:ImpA family type VI secretion system protein [Aliiroseovarius sp.]|uniref:type VI secretion system protein TssA n=1 Tax=Aliiroseovarius sp. TaxID=1872442 RepID=UPI003BAC0968
MSLEWLLEPVSEDAPCGPNLDLEDDPEFVEYYFTAMERLPQTYVTPGMEVDGGRRTEDRVFDPKSVAIANEETQIDALLERSRDLRLLVLRTQMNCLAGRVVPMAESIEAIADLLGSFNAEVHPTLADGASDRRNALGDLAEPVSMLQGLRYLGLSGTPDVTLRKLMVADGKFTPNSTEQDLSGSMMRDMLGSPGSRKQVDTVHDALLRMTEALGRIKSACQVGSTPFSPGFDATVTLLGQMREEITAARPDLLGADADVVTDSGGHADEGAGDGGGTTADATQATTAAAQAPLPPSAVQDHSQASKTLMAVELYFQANEPSSAALLLVRQARQLIGQPLVVALETLLPEECGKAIVSFGPQTGFALPAQRLKSLSDQALDMQGQQNADSSPFTPPKITNPTEVAAAVRGVEEFFRLREKSSPVPLLLQRARSYLDKDFQSLIDELIPRPPS